MLETNGRETSTFEPDTHKTRTHETSTHWRYPQGHSVDLHSMRQYRLGRLRAELARRDWAGCILFDPINVRYATDSTNMQVWILHNMGRYAFVSTEGPVVLYEYHGSAHLSEGLGTVDEIRPNHGVFYFSSGDLLAEKVKPFAAEIASLVKTYGGGNRRIGVDVLNPPVYEALLAENLVIQDAQEAAERARLIKSDEEIKAMQYAISVCEAGMKRMHEELEPGMTENALWSILHEENIRLGGEWIETRLLSSGPRTNPWFREASFRPIEEGDLVSYDTDLIGPFGYCADISRSFRCGGGRLNDEQRTLYAVSLEQINYNIDLMKPEMSFQEFAEKAYSLPARYFDNRYSSVIHGIGLCDEYPAVRFVEKGDPCGTGETRMLPGMTLCVESYIGEVGGKEGVKLEEQILITETGTRRLSQFPFLEV